MKVVQLDKPANLEATLEVIDGLRQAVLDGRAIAFAAVSIGPDDEIEAWCSAVRHMTHLRMQGAVSHLLHCMHTGDAW